MREKPANEHAVARLIGFLTIIKFRAKSGAPPNSDIKLLIKSEGVAKRTFSDCKALGIFKVEDEKYTWLKQDQDLRKLALLILDYRLTKTKKTVHYPIPDFAGFAQSLEAIAERLAVLATQNEKWLKVAKNGLETINEPANLFRVDDQRLYIAGQIASVIYQDVHNIHNDEFEARIHSRNQKIVLATDDLMKKLLNKE